MGSSNGDLLSVSLAAAGRFELGRDQITKLPTANHIGRAISSRASSETPASLRSETPKKQVKNRPAAISNQPMPPPCHRERVVGLLLAGSTVVLAPAVIQAQANASRMAKPTWWGGLPA